MNSPPGLNCGLQCPYSLPYILPSPSLHASTPEPILEAPVDPTRPKIKGWEAMEVPTPMASIHLECWVRMGLTGVTKPQGPGKEQGVREGMQPKHPHQSPIIAWLQMGLMEKKSLLQRWFSPLGPPKTPELLTSPNGLGFGAFFLLPRFPGVLLFSYTFIIIIIIIIQMM